MRQRPTRTRSHAERDPIRPPPAPTRQGSSGLSSTPLYIKYAHHARVLYLHGKINGPPLNATCRTRAAFSRCFFKRCLTNCHPIYNIKETEGRKRSFQRYIYLRINIRKPRSISNGIRNSDISLLPARYYPRSIVSGRKKVRFSGKRFQLNLPRCLKEKKKGREGGKKKKLPAQISREKAFLRARSGRQREAPSHHDRVKIRREKEKREREKGTCRGSEVARISHVD